MKVIMNTGITILQGNDLSNKYDRYLMELINSFFNNSSPNNFLGMYMPVRRNYLTYVIQIENLNAILH